MDKEKIVDGHPRRVPDLALLQKAFEAAQRRFGLQGKTFAQPPQAKDAWADARVRLCLGDWQQDFLVEMKAGLRPANLGPVMQRLAQHKTHGLLVADHVTPPMAETLRGQDLQFLDTAGNAYLKQPGVFVWVTGERPKHRHIEPRTAGRAFAATGLKVLLTLLCRPELVDRPYRDIATAAGVAHGTVGWIMPELETLGFIGRIKDKRRLLNPGTLFEQWAEAYLRVLRTKLRVGIYYAPTIDWWETVQPLKYGLTLGGEAAAARITNHLRPATVTLYGHKAEPRFLVDHQLRPKGVYEVEILQRFWNFDPEAELAPLPIIYADLVRTGDARCLETAELIREEFIARLQSQA